MEQVEAVQKQNSRNGEALEDLIGGRVLAWVGGLAVLLGIAFLFAIGVSSGWIGEGARTVLGAILSMGLLGAGIWLHANKGRTDAAVASLACGISGLFVTVTVAAQVYELIAPALGSLLAVAVGAIATTLAVRWESRGIAALGILGALCAPVLAGSDFDGGSIAILFVALTAATGVLLWQRWSWLALGALLVSAPQWMVYLFTHASPTSAVVTLTAFGVLGAVMAVGHDVRVRAEGLDVQSAFLLSLNAIFVAGAGWFALDYLEASTAGELWLAGTAVAYATLGVAGPRLAGISRELGLLALALSVVLADIAFGLAASGPVLAIGWTVTGVGFAALLRHTRRESAGEDLVSCGLGAHIALALVGALAVDDPTAVLVGDAPLTFSLVATVASIAAGCLVSARLAEERGFGWRVTLDTLGFAAVALLTALTLDGTPLVLAWVAEVVVLTAMARRADDRVAGGGALGFLALAALHVVRVDAPFELLAGGANLIESMVPVAAVGVGAAIAGRFLPRVLSPDDPMPVALMLDFVALCALAYVTMLGLDGPLVAMAFALEAAALAFAARRLDDTAIGGGAVTLLALAAVHMLLLDAPPVSLVTGLDDPLAVLGAAVAMVTAALIAADRLSPLDLRAKPLLRAAAGLCGLYVASALVVTPFESGEAVESTLLSAHQQGQMVLSVFWALVGVAAVAAGLRDDSRGLRGAALALLSVAVVKVFLFDLATMTSVYRAVSFIGLGLLLLLGAFVWQRLRPRPLADLRDVPVALR